MKYSEIRAFAPLNDTDPDKVREIADSIRTNGWQGAPILVAAETGRLITGSHRVAAIRLLETEDWFDADELGDIAEDVEDIVAQHMEDNYLTWETLYTDQLGLIFTGTWVEQYADEITEW